MRVRRSARSAPKEFTSTPWDLVVVGLGNPGSRYRNTLHNVGVDVIEELARRHDGSFRASKASALVAEIRLGAKRVALAFPQTYMNDSGRAVAPLLRHYPVEDLRDLVVIHDELDLEPGRLKLKVGGGLAGHNGLRSLRAHLHDTGFTRVRVGVGKPPGGAAKGADHVLSAANTRDRELIAVCVQEAADSVELIASEGIEAAMARYNQR